MSDELKEAALQAEAELLNLKNQFQEYKEEFYKLKAISEAFELECQNLKEKNKLLVELLKKCQDSVLNNKNLDQLKVVLSGLSL